MSLLIDGAPDWVELGGARAPVRSDYRIGLLFERLMLDDGLGQAAKAAAALRLYYPEPPPDAAAALRGILWFWNCGADAGSGISAAEDESGALVGERIFDFDADGPHIHAAFWADYGVDLCAVRLHWWKFCGMLRALRNENLFCRILEWRGTDTTQLKGAERAYVQRMQRLYALPRPRAEVERAEAIGRALAGDGDVGRVLGATG